MTRLLLAVALISCSRVLATHGEGWGQGAAMPVALGEVGCAIVNGKLYVMGYNTSQVMAYDLAAETWAAADATASRLRAGHHHSAQSVGGKLYLIGGLGNDAQGKVQVYDPATNSWSFGEDMPWAAGACATAVIDGEIYAAGGSVPGTGSVANVGRYNPATNSWTSLASMPHGHNHAAGGTDGKLFWVFGGRGGGDLDTVQVYDPATNQWESSHEPGATLAKLPAGRAGTGNAPFVLGEFYVMGGEGGTPLLHDRVDIYDPVQNTWRAGTALPMARHGIFPVAAGGAIYVAAGGDQAFAFAPTSTLQILGIPDSFDQWRQRHFTEAELNDPAKESTHWGTSADLDLDGLDTLLEYLTGLDPRSKDATGAIDSELDAGVFKLRFPRAKNTPDFTLRAESSLDLSTWGTGAVTESILSDLGDQWIVEASVPVPGAPEQFLRLKGM